MSPANEARKQTLLNWIVPALLATITGMLLFGGTVAIAIMQSQSAEIKGLRVDLQSMQIQMEKRITHLEDLVHAYAKLESALDNEELIAVPPKEVRPAFRHVETRNEERR